MGFGRLRGPPASPVRSLKRGIAIVGLVLLGSALLAPSSASAISLPATPSLPPPPSSPSLPAPSAPSVPALPQTQSHSTTDAPAAAPSPSLPPAPSASGGGGAVSSSGADAKPLSAGGSGAGGEGTAGVIPGSTAEPSTDRSGAIPLESPTRSSRAGGNVGGPAPPSGDGPSLDGAIAAPLRRWLAYVWPAVALGPFGKALGPQIAAIERIASLPLFPLTQALSSLAAGASASETPQRSARAPKATAADDRSTSIDAPPNGGMSLWAAAITALAALIGLIALARLTVGEELFSTRWLH